MTGWADRNHARVSARHPQALALCDRCGFRYNRVALQWQYEWQGMQLQNLSLLVCASCLDRPQPQFRQYPLPPDPVPIQNPRPDPYAGLVENVIILTEDGSPIYIEGENVESGAPGQGAIETDIIQTGGAS